PETGSVLSKLLGGHKVATDSGARAGGAPPAMEPEPRGRAFFHERLERGGRRPRGPRDPRADALARRRRRERGDDPDRVPLPSPLGDGHEERRARARRE